MKALYMFKTTVCASITRKDLKCLFPRLTLQHSDLAYLGFCPGPYFLQQPQVTWMQVVHDAHLVKHVCKCRNWKGELANPQRILLEFCLYINSNHLGGNLLVLFSFWVIHKGWDQEPD